MQLILASASPRRRELLKEITHHFVICPSQGEEVIPANVPPSGVALALAEAKCKEVFEKNPQATVIGCDTIVVYQGEILGKPHSRFEAIKTLTRLSGNTHEVYTGVCIMQGDRTIKQAVKTEVTFQTLTPEFILSYVEGGSPMDKAGSYGIQDEGVVKSYQGSYTNVVGFPVDEVRAMLKELGLC